MNKQRSNRGFAALEIILVLVLVAVVAAAGYLVYNRQASDDTQNTTQESATAEDVTPAPEINDASDLDEAKATLDANDPALSEDDAAKIDNELSEL